MCFACVKVCALRVCDACQQLACVLVHVGCACWLWVPGVRVRAMLVELWLGSRGCAPPEPMSLWHRMIKHYASGSFLVVSCPFCEQVSALLKAVPVAFYLCRVCL